MAGNSGNNNSSLILGVLIGVVMGLAVAGGVAWHISNRPSPFTNKETRESPPPVNPATPSVTPAQKPAQKPAVVATAPAPAASAPGVNDGKPRFQFYHILPDKETSKEASTLRGSGHEANATATPKGASSAPAPGSYFLQAGSFAKADEADKLKAKLALLGMEANVQAADVPGKGMYYRVRLGPYRNPDDLARANGVLKQNGISDAAQVRAQ